MWHFLKDLPAIQHFTVFCSLLAMPVVTWITFPSHKHTKQQQKTHKTKQTKPTKKKHQKPNLHCSLHGHRLVKIQILKRWNCCWASLFIAPTDPRASTYLTQADLKHPAKLITLKIPCVSPKRKMTPWMAKKDPERASISQSSKISQGQSLLSIQTM